MYLKLRKIIYIKNYVVQNVIARLVINNKQHKINK